VAQGLPVFTHRTGSGVAPHRANTFLGLPQNLWVKMYASAPDDAGEICVYEYVYEYAVSESEPLSFLQMPFPSYEHSHDIGEVTLALWYTLSSS